MSPVKITIKDLEALVEVIKESEYVHPSQVAKRKVFQKYGILGTTKDRVLTAIYYQVMRKLGVIDKAITRVTNLPTVHILDPWLKAALRLATYMYVFCDKPIPKGLKEDLKRGIAKFLSNNTHPYVGVWYWDLIDKVLNNYKYIPQNEIEELELKYLIPSWLIEKLRNLLGPEETEQLLQAFNKRPFLSVRVNTLKATIDEVIKELKKEGKEPIIGRYVPTIVKFKGPYKFEKSKLFKEGKIIAQDGKLETYIRLVQLKNYQHTYFRDVKKDLNWTNSPLLNIPCKKNHFLKEVLGEHIFNSFIGIKEKEFQEYSLVEGKSNSKEITKWEWKKYLNY